MVVRYRLYAILFNVALIEIQHVLKLVGVLCLKIDCFPRGFSAFQFPSTRLGTRLFNQKTWWLPSSEPLTHLFSAFFF